MCGVGGWGGGVYLRPGTLIDRIVDGDYSLHVLSIGLPAFPPHGIEEHLLAGVPAGTSDLNDDLLARSPALLPCIR